MRRVEEGLRGVESPSSTRSAACTGRRGRVAAAGDVIEQYKWCTCRMIEARITRGALRPVEGELVRDPSSLRRRRPGAEIHGAAAAAGGDVRDGKSPRLASPASLDRAYAPLIIVPAVDSSSSFSSSRLTAPSPSPRTSTDYIARDRSSRVA